MVGNGNLSTFFPRCLLSRLLHHTDSLPLEPEAEIIISFTIGLCLWCFTTAAEKCLITPKLEWCVHADVNAAGVGWGGGCFQVWRKCRSWVTITAHKSACSFLSPYFPSPSFLPLLFSSFHASTISWLPTVCGRSTFHWFNSCLWSILACWALLWAKDAPQQRWWGDGKDEKYGHTTRYACAETSEQRKECYRESRFFDSSYTRIRLMTTKETGRPMGGRR